MGDHLHSATSLNDLVVDYWSPGSLEDIWGATAVDIEYSRDGNYNFVLTGASPKLGVYAGSKLLSTVDTLRTPKEIAVHPSGRYLYARTSSSIYTFEVGPRTGALTLAGELTGLQDGAGIHFDPEGEYMYLTNFNTVSSTGSVSVLALDPDTGLPSELTTLSYDREVFVGGAYCSY